MKNMNRPIFRVRYIYINHVQFAYTFLLYIISKKYIPKNEFSQCTCPIHRRVEILDQY